MNPIPIRDFEMEQLVARVFVEGGTIVIEDIEGRAAGFREILLEALRAGDGSLPYETAAMSPRGADGRVLLFIEPGDPGFGRALSELLPSPYEVPVEVRRDLERVDVSGVTLEDADDDSVEEA